MRYLFGFMSVLALAAMGCGDTGTEQTGGTGGVGGMDTMVTLGISVAEPTQEGNIPLEGVEICDVDSDRCATTGDDGVAYMEFPADREVAYTAEKEGYAPLLSHDVSDETFGLAGFLFEVMYPHARMATWAEQIGVAYPFTGGVIGLNARLHMAGVSFELLGEIDEPFYYDAAQGYRYDLDETTGDRAYPAPFSMGGFADLADGEYEVEFLGTADPCTGIGANWPGSGPNRVRIPVRTGYISYASLTCE